MVSAVISNFFLLIWIVKSSQLGRQVKWPDEEYIAFKSLSNSIPATQSVYYHPKKYSAFS